MLCWLRVRVYVCVCVCLFVCTIFCPSWSRSRSLDVKLTSLFSCELLCRRWSCESIYWLLALFLTCFVIGSIAQNGFNYMPALCHSENPWSVQVYSWCILYVLCIIGYSRELPGNTHAEECALKKLDVQATSLSADVIDVSYTIAYIVIRMLLCALYCFSVLYACLCILSPPLYIVVYLTYTIHFMQVCTYYPPIYTVVSLTYTIYFVHVCTYYILSYISHIHYNVSMILLHIYVL